MKINKEKITELSFIIAFIFSVLTTHSNKLKFYGGTSIHVLIKLSLIILAISILTILNKDKKLLICKYPPIITNTALILFIFDNLFTNLSGSILLYKIWWLAAIFAAEGSLFITISILNTNYYKEFYYRFWKGFTPTFLITFLYCFARKPNCVERTINLIPFKRALPYFINFIKHPNSTFENPLFFFGNIIFFIPLPFIINSFFPKLKTKYSALIGFLIPILIESYQYIFSCGDVDIDDLILNWIGFGIGLMIQQYIKHKLLQKQNNI